MIKKFAIAVLFFLASAGCPAGHASAAADTIIVIIKSRNIGPYLEVAESVKKTLAGHNYDVRIAEFDFSSDAVPAGLKGNIEALKPKLILSLGTPATRAARQTFGSLPVIYAMVLNPAASNIEPPGVSMDIPFEISLRELKKILPEARKIGVIYSAGYASVFSEISRSGTGLGLEVIGKEVVSQKEFSDALPEILGQVDCFLMISDPHIYLPKTTEFLLLEALQRKVPVVGLSASYTKAGAITAFDCDYDDLGRQAAELILRVMDTGLAAAKTAVSPRKIKFSLNLKVAERLNIPVPQEILKQAGEVFGT